MLEPKLNELFVASDIIETAKEFQSFLAFEPTEKQPQKAAEAIEVMGDPRELLGGRKLIVHSLGAYVLFDNLSSDSEIYHGAQLTDVILKSEFSRLAFVQNIKMGMLCLYLFNNLVLKTREKVYDNSEISSGVFVPVHEVDSIWAYE